VNEKLPDFHPSLGITKETNLRLSEKKGMGLKGKAIPLRAWTGIEGSRSLRLPDCKTVGK